MTEAKDPDVLAAPATVALQLYNTALILDRGKSTLAYLRPRVYLLRAAFDSTGAESVLDEIAHREPRNAFPPLERARTAFLSQGQSSQTVQFLVRAARGAWLGRS